MEFSNDFVPDTYKLEFGKYKGTAIVNVPADYLLHVYRTYSQNALNKKLFHYVRDNYEAITKEADGNK